MTSLFKHGLLYLGWMSLTSSLGQLLAGCKTAVYESFLWQLDLTELIGNCKLLSSSILQQLCWIGHRSGAGTVIKFPYNCIGQIVREVQFDSVLRIRDILVRIQIRIRGSVPLINDPFFCLLLFSIIFQVGIKVFLTVLLDYKRIRIRTLY